MRSSHEKSATQSTPGPLARGLQLLLVSLVLITAAVALNLPWPLESSARAALPYLALAIVHAHAYRIPDAVPAPIILFAGLVADIVADTPLGFWALVYLGTVACARGMRNLLGGDAGFALTGLGIAASAVVSIMLALGTTYLYTLTMPDPAPVIAGTGLGALLELAVIGLAGLAGKEQRLLPAVDPTGPR